MLKSAADVLIPRGGRGPLREPMSVHPLCSAMRASRRMRWQHSRPSKSQAKQPQPSQPQAQAAPQQGPRSSALVFVSTAFPPERAHPELDLLRGPV